MSDRGNGNAHYGVDLYTFEGYPTVRSISPGVVIRVTDGRGSGKKSMERAGLWVDILSEGEKYIYRYLHLKNSLVVKGQSVSVGDKIGLIDSDHLHFEIRKNDNGRYGEAIDPVLTHGLREMVNGQA